MSCFLRRVRSAAIVIFYVLPECAHDALFATDSGFEFLVQAGKCTPVVSAEGVEHGFGEVGESLQSQLQLMLEIRVLRALIDHDWG